MSDSSKLTRAEIDALLRDRREDVARLVEAAATYAAKYGACTLNHDECAVVRAVDRLLAPQRRYYATGHTVWERIPAPPKPSAVTLTDFTACEARDETTAKKIAAALCAAEEKERARGSQP